MNPFDFPTDVLTLNGDQKDYFKFIDDQYFSVCKSSRVLEIGPHCGSHSKLIINHTPSYFEIVEGDAAAVNNLLKIPGIDKVVHNDVMIELQKNTKHFDVCICLGVLYHLHSPLHLLELMINKCQPSYLLLDCVTAPYPLIFLNEYTNTPGNCQTVINWKSCNLNFVVPFFIYNKSLHNMGYQLSFVNKQSVSWLPKNNGWTALWKLKEQTNESV
jgi:hypothetical protein